VSSLPDRPSVGVVTVNWKSPDHTRRFAGLVQALAGPPRHLVIVNNDPGDRKGLEGLEGEGTTGIHNGENLGYAEGLNQGIRLILKRGEDDCLLLMNNDTSSEKDFLEKLLESAAAGTISSLVILYHGTDVVQNTGGRISTLIGRSRNLNKGVQFELLERKTPDFLSGCCMFMHRDVVRRVSLFERRHHSCYEDADYCLRARDLGISLEILWDLKLWHAHSASTRSMPGQKVRLLARNGILLARERMPPPELPLHRRRPSPGIPAARREKDLFELPERSEGGPLLLTGPREGGDPV
jgi:GT2 family glycosyltransferase